MTFEINAGGNKLTEIMRRLQTGNIAISAVDSDRDGNPVRLFDAGEVTSREIGFPMRPNSAADAWEFTARKIS